MNEIPVPATREERERRAAALRRRRNFCGVCFYTAAAVAIASLVALLVILIVFELQSRTSDPLFAALAGSFGGAVVLFALLAFAFTRLLTAAEFALSDYIERCDSEYSFFVGEGTLAVFEKEGLRLHGDVILPVRGKRKDNLREVKIPYRDVRIFAVCTRKRPREKGEWSAVLEIPSRYLNPKTDEKLLIQADLKERLKRAARERGLLIGGEQANGSPQKFQKKSEEFARDPDAKKYLLFLILSAAVFCAGIAAAFLWEPSIGAVISVAGGFFVSRNAFSFAAAKKRIALYEEGLYYRDKRGGMFFKWEEIEKITRDAEENAPVLRLTFAYGDCAIPAVGGAYEEIEKLHPEKIA